jgi:tryptophan-rich sensory protein
MIIIDLVNIFLNFLFIKLIKLKLSEVMLVKDQILCFISLLLLFIFIKHRKICGKLLVLLFIEFTHHKNLTSKLSKINQQLFKEIHRNHQFHSVH